MRSPDFARAMTSGTGPATSSGSAVTLATPDLKPSSLPFLTCAPRPYRPSALFANGPWVPKSSQGYCPAGPDHAAYASEEARRLTARLFDCRTHGSAVLLLRERQPALVENVRVDLEDLGIVHSIVHVVLVKRDEIPIALRAVGRVDVFDHRVGERVVIGRQFGRRVGLGRDTVDDPFQGWDGACANGRDDVEATTRLPDVVGPSLDEPPIETDGDAVTELVQKVVKALVPQARLLVIRNALQAW